MTKEKKTPSFPPRYPREFYMSEGGDNGIFIYTYIRWMKSMVNWERWREREGEKEELKDAIAPISWILIVHKRFSLFLSLPPSLLVSLFLLIWENSFFLCLKRRICLCYYSSTILNFRSFFQYISNYCSDTHARYFVPFCNVLHSGTHHLRTHTHTHIYIYMYICMCVCILSES